MVYEPRAAQIRVEDSSGYFSSEYVEGVLEELYQAGVSGFVSPYINVSGHNHATLKNLNYNNAGHTGFQPSGIFDYVPHNHSGIYADLGHPHGYESPLTFASGLQRNTNTIINTEFGALSGHIGTYNHTNFENVYKLSGEYSYSTHLHSGIYADMAHPHLYMSGEFSYSTHNHSGIYAPMAHDHLYMSGEFSYSTHLHSGIYAGQSHTHSGEFAELVHTHTQYISGEYSYSSHLHSGYIPYTGATSDVDLGVFDLTAATINYTTLNPVVDTTAVQRYAFMLGR